MKKMIGIFLITTVSFVFVACGPSEIVVTTRPSPPVYVRPASPGPRYVWVEGDWVVRGGRYYWREGHWRRVSGTRIWIAGSWESRNSGWYWRRGHWR